MAKNLIESGVAPFTVELAPLRFFEDADKPQGRVIYRSSLLINSLELGVLTPAEYRYVARRIKKREELVACHIDQAFEEILKLALDADGAFSVTVPIYPKTLLSGAASKLLFEAFARHPDVSSDCVTLELSADILYEDVSLVRDRLSELRALGVKLAIFELGDEYCPFFRLASLPFDYAFISPMWEKLPEDEDERSAVRGIIEYLHTLGIKAFALHAASAELLTRAERAGFDGWCETHRTVALDEEESLGAPVFEGQEDESSDAEEAAESPVQDDAEGGAE